MQAGVGKVVALHGGAYGADVADVLYHGGQRYGHYGNYGGDNEGGIRIAYEGEYGVLHLEGQTQPCGLMHLGKVHIASDRAHHIGGYYAKQYGNYLYHALAPDVAGYNYDDGYGGYSPISGAAVNCGGGEVHAYADYDGTGDYGREEAHYLLCAIYLKEAGKYCIHQSCAGHANTGVWQQFRLAVGRYRPIAAQEGKGGAQEGGNLFLGDQVKEQSAEAREEQCCGYAEAGQRRNKHRGAEHGEHVLYAQHHHAGCS